MGLTSGSREAMRHRHRRRGISNAGTTPIHLVTQQMRSQAKAPSNSGPQHRDWVAEAVRGGPRARRPASASNCACAHSCAGPGLGDRAGVAACQRHRAWVQGEAQVCSGLLAGQPTLPRTLEEALALLRIVGPWRHDSTAPRRQITTLPAQASGFTGIRCSESATAAGPRRVRRQGAASGAGALWRTVDICRHQMRARGHFGPGRGLQGIRWATPALCGGT